MNCSSTLSRNEIIKILKNNNKAILKVCYSGQTYMASVTYNFHVRGRRLIFDIYADMQNQRMYNALNYSVCLIVTDACCCDVYEVTVNADMYISDNSLSASCGYERETFKLESENYSGCKYSRC